MVAGMLIRTAPQQSKDVYWKLKNLEGVANIVRVFGRYDLVVMLRALDIDAAGKVVAAEVSKASNEGFREPALVAVKQWVFEPAKLAGKAVPARVTIPLMFNVEG